ncbi:MAG: hypothetical protein AVDCRST_MAG10-499 [uncultured Acidimicrobiales bacterium]|uniref:DUF3291 domain-containing protein n=1 Tax=uncultured Acidimicrobiales bacterium TaxID=310071 RepID=A0A6J4HCX8_9ACTN|nr:MAG: hypothetical protein AVDCRST_MAG10-499 [uncultured Acidimicrobiales bacterium]
MDHAVPQGATNGHQAASGPPEKLYAFTTRSRLKGPWYFPHMLYATLRVRRQLKGTGDVVRWASIIAGPSEFWTISIWKSRHDMQEFMRSGAHDDIMWYFSKWLRSFWLMRWRPGPEEMGDWKGLTMARPEPAYHVVEGTKPEALEKALEHLPKLRSAMSVDGAVTYDTTQYARRRRAEVRGAGGGVMHIKTSPRRTVEAYLALRALEREARGDPDYLKGVVGISRPGQLYLLTVWRDCAGTRRMLRSPQVRKLTERFPGAWANEWLPENEFGHWDGLRLRRTRARYAIQMPKAAMDLDRGAAVDEPQGSTMEPSQG